MFSNIPINLLSETQLGRLFGFFIQRLVDGGWGWREGVRLRSHTHLNSNTLLYIYKSISAVCLYAVCFTSILHQREAELSPCSMCHCKPIAPRPRHIWRCMDATPQLHSHIDPETEPLLGTHSTHSTRDDRVRTCTPKRHDSYRQESKR